MTTNTAEKIDLFGKGKPAQVRQKDQAPAEKEISNEVNVVVADAKALNVTTADDMNNATAFIKTLKAAKKKVVDFISPLKKKQREALNAIIDREKEMIAPIDEAIDILNKKQTAFVLAEEKRKKEEQARQDRELKLKEEAIKKEAETLVAEILEDDVSVSERIEILSGLLEDEYCPEVKATVIRGAIRGLEMADVHGVDAEEAIREEIEAETMAQTVETVQEEEKIEGVVKRYNFSAEVVDMVALCQAIGEGKVPPGVVKVAQGPLNQYAKAMAGKDIPGCKVSKALKTHTRG